MFWPKELLPADTGEARILTFGYDANIAHFWARPSENRMDSYSNDLFQQLDNNRHRIDAVSFNVSFDLQPLVSRTENSMNRQSGLSS